MDLFQHKRRDLYIMKMFHQLLKICSILWSLKGTSMSSLVLYVVKH